jgi:hypothetical protein
MSTTSWKFSAVIVCMLLVPGIARSGDPVQTYLAVCSGDEEVPSLATTARATAVFHLVNDGTELAYKLIVANIENVTASHIHLAPAGVNGPVVVFLAGPFPPAGGRVNGVIAEGTITAANLIGSLAGHPLSDLIAQMEAGNAYVNVHTNDGVSPTNTGPGDFPGGEVRGQVFSGDPN